MNMTIIMNMIVTMRMISRGNTITLRNYENAYIDNHEYDSNDENDDDIGDN